MFHIESTEDLPKDQDKLIDLFATYSTKSALCVAMFFENEMTGCIGFDTTLEEKKWSEGDIELLKSIANILTHTIQKYKIKDF